MDELSLLLKLSSILTDPEKGIGVNNIPAKRLPE